MKYLVFTICTFLFVCFARTQELTVQQMAELRGVHTEQKMQNFIDNNPGLSTEVIFLNSAEKLSTSDSLLFLMGLSGVREAKNAEGNYVYFKMFEGSVATNYRVRTIFFDGKQLKLDSINKIRETILSNLSKGETFNSQYEKFNMDNRANHGDLGWTEPEALLEPFTSLVKINEIGKPFSVDIPYMNWYYIAENMEKPKEITKKKFLKVTMH